MDDTLNKLKYLRVTARAVTRTEARLSELRERRDDLVLATLGDHNQATVAEAAGVSDAYVRKIIRRGEGDPDGGADGSDR